MNISLIQSVVRCPAAKAWAFVMAATFAVASNPAASAQSGLAGSSTGGGQPVGAATFAPGTKIIPASAVPTAADVASNSLAPNSLAPGSISQAVGTIKGNTPGGQADLISQVSYGCQSCSQPGCNGGCNGGAAGCNGGCYGGSGSGYCNHNHVGFGYGYVPTGQCVCGIPCNPYYYVDFDILYMERQGIDNRSLIRNTPLGDENFEPLGRVTFGWLPDCVRGWEFTYTGNPTWKTRVSEFSATGGINSLISAGPNFDATFLDPFTDSNAQTVAYQSEYQSIEINRALVGWDVAKVTFGARYINVEDRFVYAAAKEQGGQTFTADLSSRVNNELIGLQGGLDLLYPISRIIYSDFRGRAGVYANLADAEALLRNQGQVVVRNFSDDTEVAGVFEMGGGLRVFLGEMLSLRGGLEAWYLTNYGSGNGTLNGVVNDAFGRNIDTREVFYYGVFLGAELRW